MRVRSPAFALLRGTQVIEDARIRVTLLIALAATPALLVLLAGRNGPAVSPDSVVYASAARAFATSGSLDTYTGEPLTIFPPGLSAILGIVERSGIDLQTATVFLNSICAALTVLLTFALATRILRSDSLGLVAAATVGLSASTLQVFVWLWTEPMFTVLTLVVLISVTDACRAVHFPWTQVLLVAITVSAACTIRFIGITLIPVVLLGAYLANHRKGKRIAAMRAAGAVALSSTGIVAVMIRNVRLDAAPLGDRNPSGVSPFRVAAASLRTLGGYIVPDLPMPFAVLALSVGFAAAGVATYAIWRILSSQRSRADLLVVATFVMIYWVVLWYGQLATTLDPVGPRLTAPVFSPMLILIVWGIRDLHGQIVVLPTAENHKELRAKLGQALYGFGGQPRPEPSSLWPSLASRLLVI